MSDRSNLTESSSVVTVWKRLVEEFSSPTESWTGRRLRRGRETLTNATQSSGLAAGLGTLGRWARESFLYRWLTAEPDPDVVVIDLRETYTVGPILALLDRLLTPLARAWQTASVEAGAEQLQHALKRRPVQVVSVGALVALLTELLLSVFLGSVSLTGLGLRFLFVAFALIGTRITVSWEKCTESTTYRTLAAALVPPEPPAERDER